MIGKDELFRIANEIQAGGGKPTQREIRDRLGRGSFRDIGPIFVEWLKKEGFRPRATRDDLPKTLFKRLMAVATDIWADGRRQGAAFRENEREALMIARDAADLAHKEMAARVDDMQQLLDALKVSAKDARPKGRRANVELWAGVMQEIVELLKDRQLTAKEIIAELSKETLERAHHLRERGGAGLLASKMRHFAGRGRYFSYDEDKKLFGCLTADAGGSGGPAPVPDATVTAPRSPSRRQTTPQNVVKTAPSDAANAERLPAGRRRKGRAQ